MRNTALLRHILALLLCLSLTAPLLPVRGSSQEEWGVFFGQLHAHSDFSSGDTPVEDLFQAASRTPGLDFFAVTDHAHSLDHGDQAELAMDARGLSAEWAAGKAAAQAATGEAFLGLYGFELSWQQEKQLGHIAVFSTPGFVTRDREPYRDRDTALSRFYDDLAGIPGAIGMFCHPGSLYGTFQNLEYASAYRNAAISLLEVGSGADALFYFDLALEQGWQVAPTGGEGGMTAVLARSLTEEDLFDALRSRRVYATEDPDLEISYTLDGHILGSRLERRQTGELVEIRVAFRDATDPEGASLQVIVEGGAVAAGCTLGGSSGAVSFTLPADHPYYYIRVTQPDGDTAVTAPVWVDQTEAAGIRDFFCETGLPIQNRETGLVLELYNDEAEALTVEAVTLSLDESPIHSARPSLVIGPGETRQYRVSHVHSGTGGAALRAEVTASLGAARRSYEARLSLTFRPAELVSGVLVDGAHRNTGLDALEEFTALSESHQKTVRRVTQWAGESPDCADLLLVTAPGAPFSEEFLAFAAEFVQRGGSLAVCGQADSLDTFLHSSRELNRLLSAVGSGLRLGDNEVRDPRENLGLETDLTLRNFNESSHWYATELESRVFRQSLGCAVEGGTALVTGHAATYCRDADGDGGEGGSTVVLAWEQGCGGGDILVSGGFFLADAFLKEPQTLWKSAYANRTFARKLLKVHREQPELTAISAVRRGTQGKQYRIRGYLTVGNEDSSTSFGDVLYIQDASGGIALKNVTEPGLAAGTALELTGLLTSDGKNPVLEVLDLEQGTDAPQFWGPAAGSYSRVMDNSLHGGQLVRVEGEVVSTNQENGVLSEFLLRSADGRYATVTIGSTIRSPATGKNTLADTVRPGREVRAIGILYLREDGVAAVRVRNCDEVSLLSSWPYADTPNADPTNPPTGDPSGTALAAVILSLAALLLHGKRKKEG